MSASILPQRIAYVALTLCAFCLLCVSRATPPIASADGGAPNLAYVLGAGPHSDDLVVIDIAKRAVTSHATIGADPSALALSVDNRYAYIAQTTLDRIVILDTRTLHILATIPVGSHPQALALDPSRNPTTLYVANTNSATVTALDPDGRHLLATIPVGQQPSGIAIASPGSGVSDPSDAEIFVANATSDTVSIISARRKTVIATVPASGGPFAIVIPQAGGVAYVATRAGSVLAISLADHKPLGAVIPAHSGSTLGAMDYDAITGQVYVPNLTANVVDALQPIAAGDNGSAIIPPEPARELPFGGAPAAVAITFEGALGFVAERDAGAVAMFDVALHQTLATIPVGGAPHAIITGSYPPIFSRQAAGAANILLLVIALALVAAVIALARVATTRRSAPPRLPGASPSTEKKIPQ